MKYPATIDKIGSMSPEGCLSIYERLILDCFCARLSDLRPDDSRGSMFEAAELDAMFLMGRLMDGRKRMRGIVRKHGLPGAKRKRRA